MSLLIPPNALEKTRDLELEARGLPELAFVDNKDRSPGAPPVIGVRRGESGYYPIYTRQTAAQLNEAHGVTPAQREAMHNGSLFGWDVPGADPRSPLVLKVVARETAAAQTAAEGQQ